MIFNSNEIGLYNRSFPSAYIKQSLATAIQWDLESAEEFDKSQHRLRDLIISGDFDVVGEYDDPEKAMLGLISNQASIAKYLDNVNLMLFNRDSNSYTANYVWSTLGEYTSGYQGLWINGSVATLIANESDVQNDRLINLEKLYGPNDMESLNLLTNVYSQIKKNRDEIREAIFLHLDNKMSELKKDIMAGKLVVNFDLLEELKGKLKKRSDDLHEISLEDIRRLPPAIEFTELYSNPQKFNREGYGLVVDNENQIVTLHVVTNQVWHGFTDDCLMNIDQDLRTKIKTDLSAYYQRQCIGSQDRLINQCKSWLAHSFCRAFKVVAGPSSVIVIPFDSEAAEIGKVIAIKIIEKLKDSDPEIYSRLNGVAQSTLAMTGSIDPRVMLAVAYDINQSVNTIFADTPISSSVREAINFSENLAMNNSHQKGSTMDDLQ